MLRGIDHIVWTVADLTQARASFRRLGFRTAPRANHPFGTANVIVQLANQTFLELVAIADASKIPGDQPGKFNFAGFHRDFMARNDEGLSMIAATGGRPSADDLEFAATGAETFDRVDFERIQRAPDGNESPVSFSLTFARDKTLPDIGFFSCKHHQPENFWSTVYQRHTNGAAGVIGLVMVSEDPADHHEFVAGFFGQRDMRSTSLGIEIAAANASISILSPVSFQWRYGVDVDAHPARLRAVRLSVNKFDATKTFLSEHGITHEERFGALVVPPTEAHGATLIFE